MDLIQECLTPWAVVIHQFSIHPLCSQIYASGVPNSQTTLTEYLIVFLKTYIYELPFYYFFLKQVYSLPKIIGINLVINLATHPIIFLLMPYLFQHVDFNYLQYLTIAEIFAPTVEALLLNRIFKISWKIAVAAAIVANLFSWSVGVIWG